MRQRALVSQFKQAGLGHIAQSWVGNGPNQSVSPQQLQSVFGEQQVQGMASQAGMAPNDFLSQLSQHLANAVHGMTPNGQLPDESTLSVLNQAATRGRSLWRACKMVDENRGEDTVKNLGGKVQDVVGGLTGDAETKARGKMNQAAGTAQDTYGSALDAVSEWSESIVGRTKEKPLTALLVAVSIGYMIRMLTHASRR